MELRSKTNKDVVKSDDTLRELIPEYVSECAIYLHKQNEPCMSPMMLKTVAATHQIVETQPMEIIQHAKDATGCSSEKCVLSKLNTPDARKEIATNFKISGPIDNKLLSNINIDGILMQWQKIFTDFHPYNFNMRNYASYSFRQGEIINRPDTLSTVLFSDLYEQGKRCAGCVINSDVYQGGGKHWMALFVDARTQPATVEFFNSSGRAPAMEWISWLVKTQEGLTQLGVEAKIVKSTAIKHQESRSECGLYSLFYIWARLNKVPCEYFLTHPIHDKYMFEFRQHLFADDRRDPNWIENGKFNWEKYQQTVRLDWE
jgi:hypothetical protein